MLDVILDTLLDTVKLLPFLYLAYLLMEFLEHKSGGAAGRLLGRSGKIGPLFGGAFGAVPQCGFSAAASGLYAGRLITVGTLLAVYLSTSDEMLPILISEGAPVGVVLKILLGKVVIGVVSGFAVDGVIRLARAKTGSGKPSHDDEPCIEDICEREHCQCGEHYALSALKHTAKIAVFILIFSFVMNAVIYYIGEETLENWIAERKLLGNLLAALLGLIPNCSSSVVLTELYLRGILSPGAALSGLLVNAGIGLAVLFRNNRPLRDSFRVLAILFLLGLAWGFLIDITPIGSWLAL